MRNAKINLGNFLATVCASLVAGCASNDPVRDAMGSYRNYTEIEGTIENNRYISPSGNFSCLVPELLEPGARIRDAANETPDGSVTGTVGFEDDLGTLYRVDWFEIIPDLTGAISDHELFDRLYNYQMATYQQLVPKVVLETNEFGTDPSGNSFLFFSARMSQGSTLANNGQRLDASRASLIIKRGNWAYALITQDTHVTNPVLGNTVEEKTTGLRSKLDKFLEGFEFK